MRAVMWLALAAATVLPMAGGAVAAEVDPFGFAESDYSSWGITDAAYPFDPAAIGKPNDYGCFPVGNGLVFAHLGVDGDFNTLRGIIGPGYQTRNSEGGAEYWQAGEWPDIRIATDRWHKVVPGAQPAEAEHVEIISQSIQQVRGAAMVRTVQESTAGAMYCLTYAVPGIPVIIREFAFEPADESRSQLVQIELPEAVIEGDDLVVYHGGNRLTLQCSALIALDDRTLLMWEDGIDGCKRAAFAVMTTGPGEPRPALELDAAMAAAYRQRALKHWQDWSAKTQRFDTGDARLDDMLIQLPVIIETQRDAFSGGVSPMVSYHGYWVRDSMGPILTYLDNDRFAEVMRMLRYHRAACLKYQSCHMLVPLDLDLSELPGWRHGEAGTAGDLSRIGVAREDWEGVPVEHAEVPSLIVLQHFLRWRAMVEAGREGEAEAFIREAWPFITHNLFAMEFHEKYGAYFHGDETYTHGALYSTYDREESGAIGFPNGYIPTEGFTSFDNTILHRAAAAAVFQMAGQLGELGDEWMADALVTNLDEIIARYEMGGYYAMAFSTATDQPWRTPFSNIALRPFWLSLPYGELEYEGQFGYALQVLGAAAGYQYADNQTTDYRRLVRSRNTSNNHSTPWSYHTTGHNLGYWLDAALSQHQKLTYLGYVKQLLDSASPEGAWCEVIGPDNRPVDIYGRTNRIRPWESGINYHALLKYAKDKPSAEEIAAAFEDYKKNWNEIDHNPIEPDPVVDKPADGTQLIVLTVKPGWLERARQIPALANIAEEQICAWDAGLPFTPDELREALMTVTPAEDMIYTDVPYAYSDEVTFSKRIPYLFIDEGIERGLSRRTFKDNDFWSGYPDAETLYGMQPHNGGYIDLFRMEPQYGDYIDLVVTHFLAAGGQAFGDLGPGVKPPWTLELSWVEGEDGYSIRVAMPDGAPERYTVTGSAQTADTTMMDALTKRGLLPSIDWNATLRITPGADLSITFPDTDAEFMEQLRSLPIEFTVTSDETGFTFTHVLPPAISRASFLKSRLPDGGPEDFIPRATAVTPVLDGQLDDWPDKPSLTLTPATGQSWTGSFDGPEDASVMLWLGYDKDKLYAAAKVRDDKLPQGGTWNSDRINLVFDARLNTTAGDYPAGGTGHLNWQADDFWVFIAPYANAGFPEMIRLGGEQPGGSLGYYGGLTGAEAVVIPEDGGYTCEWAIPLANLPHLDPQPGAFTGFTFFYTDIDESLSELMFLTNWGSESGIEWRFWDCGLLYFEP